MSNPFYRGPFDQPTDPPDDSTRDYDGEDEDIIPDGVVDQAERGMFNGDDDYDEDEKEIADMRDLDRVHLLEGRLIEALAELKSVEDDEAVPKYIRDSRRLRQVIRSGYEALGVTEPPPLLTAEVKASTDRVLGACQKVDGLL